MSRFVTNGRHLCRLTDDYRLEYLDGTSYGAPFDDSWTPIVVMDTPLGMIDLDDEGIQLEIIEDYGRQVKSFVEEPEHRFGDTYRIGGSFTIICAFPETEDAWAVAGHDARKSWREVKSIADARGVEFRIERRRSMLVRDRRRVHEGSREPRRGFGRVVGADDELAICAFPGAKRAWAVYGSERRMSWSDALDTMLGTDEQAKDYMRSEGSGQARPDFVSTIIAGTNEAFAKVAETGVPASVATRVREVLSAESTPLHALNIPSPDGALDPVRLGASDEVVTDILSTILTNKTSVANVAWVRRSAGSTSLRGLVDDLIQAGLIPDSSRDEIEAFRKRSPLNRTLVG